jgi:hypothetical protein
MDKYINDSHSLPRCDLSKVNVELWQMPTMNVKINSTHFRINEHGKDVSILGVFMEIDPNRGSRLTLKRLSKGKVMDDVDRYTQIRVAYRSKRSRKIHFRWFDKYEFYKECLHPFIQIHCPED